MPFPKSPTHSPDWFDNCFEIGETEVPPDLRRMSEALCLKYDIRGICDPMYIANVAAATFGRGDGRGTFHAADSSAQEQFDQFVKDFVARIQFAYSATIRDTPEAVAQVVRDTLAGKTAPV